MCKLGLMDFMRQCGSVNLHGQNTFSNKRYEELKGAQKMLKNYIKGTELKIDIYDANNLPKGKSAYYQVPDNVYVEVTDLMTDKVFPEEFFDRANKEPVIRRIFKFVEKVNGVEESPMEHLINITRMKYRNYLKNSRKISA